MAWVCRKIGVSEATYNIWKRKVGGLGVSELRRLKQLEEENARIGRPAVTRTNGCWSMDVVADQLFNGQRVRALTVVDNFGLECLAITVDTWMKGDAMVATMDHLKVLRRLPGGSR